MSYSFLAVLLVFFLSNTSKANETSEPIPYLERYKSTFFLVGKPLTKVQISFKVELVREVPLNFGYSQLMIWDLFTPSSPFRDINYNPDFFYRMTVSEKDYRLLDLGAIEHESNGRSGAESRSWNRIYLRYTQSMTGKDQKWSWSIKAAYPITVESGSESVLEHRGVWELLISGSSLFQSFFDVNELTLRIYAGGKSRVDITQGGQELTYREKRTSRIFLMPLYIQIFHGYGENQLDADDNHWGLRAGIGF